MDGSRPCHVADHDSPRSHRIHCHVTLLADSPRLTRGRSVRHLRCVSRAQSLGTTSHPQAHSSARAPHLPSTPLLSLSLSLPPTLPKHPLSLAKPWRSFPSSTLAIEALPHRSITGGRRRTTPTSCTTPISASSLGRSFPNKLLPLLHPLPQAQARRTTPSYSKSSPTT